MNPSDSTHSSAAPSGQGGAPSRRPETLLSLMLAALLWWVLAAGDAASWVVGVPVVAAAGWSYWRLHGGDAGRISPWGLLRFIPFFLWESIRGGVDVAARVLRPRMEIHPGFVSHTTALRSPAARLLFVNCISLLQNDRIQTMFTRLDPGSTDPCFESIHPFLSKQLSSIRTKR